LGIWAGDGGEGAKYWLAVLTEIKNRGVQDVCIVVCDGLKGLPESITTTWELAQVQTCVVHLIRNTFRYAARQDWDAMAKDLRPICTAPSVQAAEARLAEFAERWQGKYPAAVKLWRSAWVKFIPFLDYEVEIRKVISRDQRDRVSQRLLPARGPGPGPLPQRGRRPQVPLPGHPVPGPDRPRSGTLGHPLESRTERLRHHLRRAHQPVDQLRHQMAPTPKIGQSRRTADVVPVR
jgi:putative transposase